MQFRLVASWLLLSVAVAVAAAPLDIQPALHSLRAYRFGADRKPVDAIEQAVGAVLADPAGARAVAGQLAQFLRGEATYDAKQFVCRQLVLVATDAELGVLTDLLRRDLPAAVATDQPEALAHMALLVLNRLPGSAVDAALREVLPQTQGATRVEVLETLSRRQDTRSIPALSAMLSDPTPAAAQAAAVALGRFGDKAALKSLQQAYAKAAIDQRAALAEAILRSAESLATGPEARAAAAAAESLLDKAPTDRLQAAALRVVVLARGVKAVPQLVDALKADGTARQEIAADIARRLPNTEVTCGLARSLPCPGFRCTCGRHGRNPANANLSPYAQTLVLAVLAERNDRAALPAVLELLAANPPETVALAAVQAAGALGDARAVSALLPLAAGESSLLATAARTALDDLKGRDIDPALLQTLQSAPAALQVEAIKTLGNRSATAAVPALLQASIATDRKVRAAAHRVLRDLAAAGDLPALVDRLLAAPAAERPEITAAIAATARRADDDRQRTEALLARLPRTSNPELQAALLDAIGQIGGTPALAALRQALGSDHSDIRLAALRQLAEWPTDEPAPDLLAAVKAATDAGQRTIALRGYTRLLAANEQRSATDSLRLYREAMDLARSPEEQRLVLAGLAKVRSREALDYAAGFVAKPELQAEAQLAVAEIGRATVGAARDAVVAALTPIAAQSTNPAAQARAKEALALAEKLGEFLTAWAVSPPYSRGDLTCNQLFDAPFAPEIAAEAGTVPWRLMPAGLNAEQPWLMDLLALYPGEQKVAYLRTRLLADTSVPVVLELGSDDGAKIWLNGEVIFANNTQRAVAPAQDKVNLTLKPGANDLLLKVTQNVMGWGACARLVTPAGAPVPGIKAEAP